MQKIDYKDGRRRSPVTACFAVSALYLIGAATASAASAPPGTAERSRQAVLATMTPMDDGTASSQGAVMDRAAVDCGQTVEVILTPGTQLKPSRILSATCGAPALGSKAAVAAAGTGYVIYLWDGPNRTSGIPGNLPNVKVPAVYGPCTASIQYWQPNIGSQFNDRAESAETFQGCLGQLYTDASWGGVLFAAVNTYKATFGQYANTLTSYGLVH